MSGKPLPMDSLSEANCRTLLENTGAFIQPRWYVEVATSDEAR